MHYSVALAEEPYRFLPFLLVLLLAFFVPIVLSRFRRLPVVVGEIVAGIIIGPTVLGWVTDGEILIFMADVGLAFLMFLAGMEINVGEIFPARNQQHRAPGPNLARMALGVYALTVVLAALGALLLGRLGAAGDPWLLAFVLSATSLGVVLPTIKDRGLSGERFGQLVLLCATLADFITIVLLTVYIITFEQGLSPQILLLSLLFLAFLIFYRIGPAFVRQPAVRQFFDDLSHATVQIKVRGAILLLIMFVVLAEFVNAELILGAFLAGMIISLLKSPEDEGLVERLEAFGFGFFIPVFFIMVGVALDLRGAIQSPERLLLLPVMFLVSIPVKLLPMALLRGRLPGRELLAGGFLLNTHLSLEVAIAVIGQRVGLLDTTTSTLIILFAVLTVLTMPLIFNALLPASPRQKPRHILAVGVSDLAIQVAEELRRHGDDVRFLEDQPALAGRAEAAGFTVTALPPDESGVQAVDASVLSAVLALSEDDDLNLRVAGQARTMDGLNVVAYVQDPQHLPAFQQLGVQPFMNSLHRVTTLALMARNPDTYKLLTSTEDDRGVVEVQLRNPQLAHTLVRDLMLPSDVLVVSVQRRGELLIPRGNTVLELGDRLTLVGAENVLEPVQSWLAGRGSYQSILQESQMGLTNLG